jgi:hypothetical protein
VSIKEDQLQASRRQPAYRAGVWALRLMIIILFPYIGLAMAGLGGTLWLLLAYLAAMTTGFVLLDRAGVRIFGLSDGIWIRRKIVYRDVFGLGRRALWVGTSTAQTRSRLRPSPEPIRSWDWTP